MKFAAILGTRDEADILPLVIGQLRDIGVELIVVIDVGSKDGTLEYLAAEEAAGDIWVLHEPVDIDDVVERAATTAIARSVEADWLLFLDSDEVPLPQHGSLHELDGLADVDILAVPRFNAVLGPSGPLVSPRFQPEQYDQVLVYAQPIPDFYYHMQREPETPWIRGVLEPKVLVRPEAVEALHRGRHDIDAGGVRRWRRAVSHDLLLAHLPFRDLERFEMRAANVREVIDASPEDFTGWTAWQWQRFAQMDREGRTREEFDRQVVDAHELAELRARRIIRTVAEIYGEPITSVESDEEWMSLAARAEPWLHATSVVSRRERIQPEAKIEHVSRGGEHPVVLLPPDHVVKFYAPWRDGEQTMERELRNLRLLEADATLEVPRVVSSGRLRPDLQYTVMTRVPGVALATIDYQLEQTERASVATWIGAFVGRMQAVDMDAEQRAAGWARFESLARWRHGQLLTFATRRGFSAAFVARLGDWLPSIEELLGTPGDAAFCHGNLGSSNLMGRPSAPGFEPQGVIDFSASFVGHPLADLGALWWDTLARDRMAFQAFLATPLLSWQGDDGFARRALAWALMTPMETPEPVDGLADVSDPEELADEWFGSVQPA